MLPCRKGRAMFSNMHHVREHVLSSCHKSGRHVRIRASRRGPSTHHASNRLSWRRCASPMPGARATSFGMVSAGFVDTHLRWRAPGQASHGPEQARALRGWTHVWASSADVSCFGFRSIMCRVCFPPFRLPARLLPCVWRAWTECRR